MTALKKGNVFAHAKKSGQTVRFKSAAAKKTVAKKVTKKVVPSRKTAPKTGAKPVSKKAHSFKYALMMRPTAASLWRSVGIGANSRVQLEQIGKLYAKSYPKYEFKIA